MPEQLLVQTVDISSCEQEPIHIPGRIQPHGVLFVLREPELTILQVSENIATFFNLAAEAILTRTLEVVLGQAQLDVLKIALQHEDVQALNPLKIRISTQGQERVFDGIVHRVAGLLILELEPTRFEEGVALVEYQLKVSVAKLQRTTSLHHLCQIAAEEVRHLTAYDRVMVYQFDEGWNGNVIAEARAEGQQSFLNLRFPASDIPRQARELYLRNSLRIIPSTDYTPSAIIPTANPITHYPLDLSHSVLRSVSPMHIEYLKNMGVSASMCISLLEDEKLWGLIVCHHHTTKLVPHEVRKACDCIGQTVSSLLSTKKDYEEQVYETQVKLSQSNLLAALSREDGIIDGLSKHAQKLQELLAAQGLAICFEDRLVTSGLLPAESELRQLLTWLHTQDSEFLHFTDSLPQTYAQAEQFKDSASGLLALTIDRSQSGYVLWFRPEVVQTVNWGGDPNKPVEVGEQTLTLHPRRSFELWKQTIRLTSLPWRRCEIDAANELGQVVRDILQREMKLKQKLSKWLNK